MTTAMKNDMVWRETQGDYCHLPKEKHPIQGLMFGWSILMHIGLDLDYRVAQGWDEVKKEVFTGIRRMIRSDLTAESPGVGCQ